MNVKLLGILVFGAANLSTALAAPNGGSRPRATPSLPSGANAENAGLISVSGAYKLAPGDVLKVSVAGYPDYGADAVVVPPDGVISVPILGEFSAKNKTVAQVQDELRARLATRMRDPKRLSVALSGVHQVQHRFVYVLGGAVQKPGAVEIRDGFHVAQVVAAAGDLRPEVDEVRATLARRGQLFPIDLQDAKSNPASASNRLVQDGDTLNIEAIAPGQISIGGDVARAGFYELRRAPQPALNQLPLHPHLLDAIVAAGGLSTGRRTGSVSDRLSEFDGTLQRGAKKIELPALDALSFKDSELNIALQPGDSLLLRALPPLNVYVDGLVKTPGNLQIARGAGVVEAIAQAGGLTQPMEKIAATIRRNGQPIAIDLSAAILGADAKSNVLLQPNDVLEVGEAKALRVQVSGDVAKPGAQKLPLDARLFEAITQAGSLSPTLKPDDVKIRILRKTSDGERVLAIDPVGLMTFSDISQNVALQDGDFVSVSQIKKSTAYVSGEVAKPGAYEIKEGQNLAALLTQAGGPNADAALSKVSVQRGDKTATVDLLPAFKSGQTVDFKLEGGDFVVVPQNSRRVLLSGALAKPGIYFIPEGGAMTIGEAMAQAGGALPGAKTQQIALLRQTEKGAVQTKVISLESKNGAALNAALKEPLQTGDVVFVPEGRATETKLDKASKAAGLLGFLRFLIP